MSPRKPKGLGRIHRRKRLNYLCGYRLRTRVPGEDWNPPRLSLRICRFGLASWAMFPRFLLIHSFSGSSSMRSRSALNSQPIIAIQAIRYSQISNTTTACKLP